MNPKEKAIDLVRAYNFLILDTHLGGSVDRAKQCALLCVDEIILAINNTWAMNAYDYWEEVREEIEKL